MAQLVVVSPWYARVVGLQQEVKVGKGTYNQRMHKLAEQQIDVSLKIN